MDRVDYQSLVIQDLINLDDRNELDTSPWYQRRSVWNNGQKSYLINTLFEKKPLPNLYIRHSLDLDRGLSIKEVVDGQQRTRAIMGYYRDEFAARHPEHPRLIKYSALNRAQKQSFLLTSIPVGYLLGATDSDVIDIFARINSVSKTLNAQEKRNAQFSGEFKQFCITQSVKRTEFWKLYKIFSGNDIARMTEVQFMSDVTINLLQGLSDFKDSEISDFYKRFDDDFPEAGRIDAILDRIFNFLVSLNPAVIRETIFNRQPLFFSLLIAIGGIAEPRRARVEQGMVEIDNRFNSDIPLAERERADIEFYNASSSTTQRIRNRVIRDAYIKTFID
jgi:hypothetical protein